MEAPPNLNQTAEPIESNENKMSCRETMSLRQLIAVFAVSEAGELLCLGFEHLRKDVIL
jgi:hypothetical protein